MTAEKGSEEIARELAMEFICCPHGINSCGANGGMYGFCSRCSAAIKAIKAALDEAAKGKLMGLHAKVMALDNRVGTPTQMQYAVRDLIRAALKDGEK